MFVPALAHDRIDFDPGIGRPRPFEEAVFKSRRTLDEQDPTRACRRLDEYAARVVLGHEFSARCRRLDGVYGWRSLAGRHLEHLAHRRAGDLSFGQSRLVEMARAIVSRPRLLLLDEPAAGLRGGLIEELALILKQLRAEGMSILVVEHRVRLVMDMCDRVVVLNLGDKIADGRPTEVMTSPAVVRKRILRLIGTTRYLSTFSR